MSRAWAWICGILVGLCIVALIAFGRSEREAYWAHRALVVSHARQAEPQPEPVMILRIRR
jgi:hypothetical protein